MKRSEARHLATVGATLGEGPVWVERDQALWFVDIKRMRAYRFRPSTGDLDHWTAPDQIGWLLPVESGGFLAGLATGIYHFDPVSGCFALVSKIEHGNPGNRLNDAAIDPAGRIWFGSMDNGEGERTGRLYVWDRGTVRDSGAEPVAITNGPAIAPDGRTLYAVDTLGRSVLAYDVSADGVLSGSRRFLTFSPEQGNPDGAIADSEGGIWIGFYRGWSARRYAPDGTQTHEVRFPVSNITKIALGGPDDRTAYATTASHLLDADALRAQPQAGDLFTFQVDVPGVPVRPVRI